MKSSNNTKRRTWIQKTFEVKLSSDSKASLSYFIKQELAYYNALVEQLTPWLRAFPQELINFKGNEKRIWNTVAEHGLDIKALCQTKLEEWPVNLSAQKETIYNLVMDNNQKLKLTARQLELLRIPAAPAKLPTLVRNIIASEMLKHMQSQAEILESAFKTEVMRSPVQMLSTHTLDTKRHLQIPRELIWNLKYNAETKISSFMTSYCKNEILVPDTDLTTMPFKMVIIKSPHPSDKAGNWYIELKENNSYTVNLTDYDDKRRRR